MSNNALCMYFIVSGLVNIVMNQYDILQQGYINVLSKTLVYVLVVNYWYLGMYINIIQQLVCILRYISYMKKVNFELMFYMGV